MMAKVAWGRPALGLTLIALFFAWLVARSTLLELMSLGTSATIADPIAWGLHAVAWGLLLGGVALVATSRTKGDQNTASASG